MAKNKGKGKIVACVLALVIAGGAVCAAGVGSSVNGKWFQNGDIPTWFNSWGKGVQTMTPEAAEGGVVITEGEGNCMRLMSAMIPAEEYAANGIDAQSAEQAYNLSVTYIPEDTTYQETTYTISFENPTSTWANGKVVTNYATVSQSETGSKDAVVTVLQSFNEPIIVTATSNRNNNIKATARVEYRGYSSFVLGRQVVNGEVQNVGNIPNPSQPNPTFLHCGLSTFDADGLTFPVSSLMVGTLAPASSTYKLYVEPTDIGIQVLQSLKSSYSSDIQMTRKVYTPTFDEAKNGYTLGSIYDYFELYAKDLSGYNQTTFRKALDTYLFRAGRTVGSSEAIRHPLFKLTYEATHTYSNPKYPNDASASFSGRSGGNVAYVYVNNQATWQRLEVRADGLSLSETIIVAG